jgi:hypothetical protein
MSSPRVRRFHIVLILGSLGLMAAGALAARRHYARTEVIHVFAGGDIQQALEAASRQSGRTTVRVHEGTYAPRSAGEALIFLNARHDGISLEADGAVTLTAANPALADPQAPSYPAVVNHVVYFGEGITRRTTLRGFKITGANGYVSGPTDLIAIRTRNDLMRSIHYRTREASRIEPNVLEKTEYFYTDGGGILIHGQSYPTIEAVDVCDNYSTVCGGGVSVQHHGDGTAGPVLFKDCIFRNNSTAVSGGAVDLLLPGSAVEFENCLFEANASNVKIGPPDEPEHGVLTVFPGCRVVMRRCTFAGNRNAVDDLGTGSLYEDSVFWCNASAARVQGKGFEISANDTATIRRCHIGAGRKGTRHAPGKCGPPPGDRESTRAMGYTGRSRSGRTTQG